MRSEIGLAWVLLTLWVLGGCAGAGTQVETLEPTYVMVFTVAPGPFTRAVPHCSGNCSPGRTVSERRLFHVEDADARQRAREGGHLMYSPQWHHPDLETARKWAGCVIDAFDRPDPAFGKVTISSAYLIRVLGPGDALLEVQRAGPPGNPCEVPALLQWRERR